VFGISKAQKTSRQLSTWVRKAVQICWNSIFVYDTHCVFLFVIHCHLITRHVFPTYLSLKYSCTLSI